MREPKKRSWETVEYTDNPELPNLEDLEMVKDFLPSPEELANAPVHVIRDQEVAKVTVTLSQDKVNFLKKHAKQLHMTYDGMISAILDQYVKKKSAKK